MKSLKSLDCFSLFTTDDFHICNRAFWHSDIFNKTSNVCDKKMEA